MPRKKNVKERAIHQDLAYIGRIEILHKEKEIEKIETPTEAAVSAVMPLLSKRKERKSEIAEGYELIITEKPQAAMKIADALGNAEKKSFEGIPYYEVVHGGKKIVVVCAAGHLFTLAAEKRGFPVFDISWQPNFQVRKKDFTKKYYLTIANFAKNANSFVIATDYDAEGELIGWNILRFICKQPNAKRMKFSTLTASDIEDSYNHVMKSVNFGLAKAGETRHILDWFYGINLSRALMEAIKKAGSFKLMSIGRVQGPALSLVVAREKEIRKFKPKPYWQVFLLVSNSEKVEVKYEKNIEKQSELAKFHHLKGKEAIAETKKEIVEVFPLTPFDLTTLQMESYRLHNLTPSQVLNIAQQLYLVGLISYPRTSSQKLPPSIGYKKILEKLKKNFSELIKHAVQQKPVEGKKSDAHPAIFPTGENMNIEMTAEQHKIYELIVKRFIACFCDKAIIENKKITVRVDGIEFFAQGLTIKEKGWINVYKANITEKKLPDLNGRVIIREIRIEEKQTQPPYRYSQASLVSELSKKNLGTKSTRAMIIDTLYNRSYITGRTIEATALGIVLIDTLKKESPVIVDEKLTRHFEKEMEKIERGKEKGEKVVNEVKEIVAKIVSEFRNKEEKIGSALIEGIRATQKQEREASKIMQCPECKQGNLIVRKNKQGRQFLACDKYPECKQTFSLPPYGFIKKTDKICECGFPLLMTIRKNRRPWVFCFNPNCPKRNQTEKIEKS